MHGIISGIENGAGASWRIEEPRQQCTGGAKRFLGIHSPSRVFAEEVGHWIPHGIAEGIKDSGRSQVRQAVNAVTGLSLGRVAIGLPAGASSWAREHLADLVPRP